MYQAQYNKTKWSITKYKSLVFKEYCQNKKNIVCAILINYARINCQNLRLFIMPLSNISYIMAVGFIGERNRKKKLYHKSGIEYTSPRYCPVDIMK